MASVSSLDQDMRKLRMDRYTPEAASEARAWIEKTLGERIASGDLLDALKDGVALCKLANMVLPPPGIKFKASAMPFTQRENISHFLTACEMPPLSLPAHDRFLTVDLYDNKDPAQVMQCLGAFSRAANAANSFKFPSVIGPRRSGAPSPTRQLGTPPVSNESPHNYGGNKESPYDSKRGLSPLRGDSGTKRAAGGGTTSSWSNKSDEATSAPAWNIHQYGYMGGASQGNQGISFGSRRQIIAPPVNVPSLAEKEKRMKEAEIEAERLKLEAEQREREQRTAKEAEEEKARIEEEQRWEEESRKAREKERLEVERERKRWEEEERRWREEEEKRRQEEPSLRGQYLSEYQSDQRKTSRTSPGIEAKQDTESERIKQLERQLEEARERERQYQEEREQRRRPEDTPEPEELQDSYRRPQSLTPENKHDSWSLHDEQEAALHEASPEPPRSSGSFRPLSGSSAQVNESNPVASARPGGPLSPPQAERQPAPAPPSATAEPPRPLPDPTKYSSPIPAAPTRTDRFLATNPAPSPSAPRSHFPAEMGLSSTSERAVEDARRAASQAQTKAGGWASKSLLEREMEMERERQREWEQAQMAKRQGAESSTSPPPPPPAGSGRLMGPREMR